MLPVGDSLAFAVTATDVGTTETLTFSVAVTGGSLTSTSAGFTSFPSSPATGTSPQSLAFNGTAATVGDLVLTFTADDGVGGTAIATLALTIQPPPAIGAPTGPGTVVGTKPDYSTVVQVGDSLAFDVTATDGGAATTLTLSVTVNGGTLDAASAGFTTPLPGPTNGNSPQTLSFTGTAAHGGSIELQFDVSDGVGGSDMITFTIYINDAPEIAAPTGPGTVSGTDPTYTSTVAIGDSFGFTIEATDANPADSLTLSATINTGASTLSASQAGFATTFPHQTTTVSPAQLTFLGTASQAGTLTLDIMVDDGNDGNGGNDQITLEITITAPTPSMPFIVATSATPDCQKADGTQTALFTATVRDADGLPDIQSVVLDVSELHGTPAGTDTTSMYDDATNGDVTASDGIFSITYNIPDRTVAITTGFYQLPVTATDTSTLTGTAKIELLIYTGTQIHVDDTTGNDGTGTGNSGSPYQTIQKGLDSATNGDCVLVHDGTYTGGTSPSISRNRDLDFKGKEIILKSENGPETTIIDCQGAPGDPHRGFYFHTGETPSSIISGLCITNGYTEGSLPDNYGAGIYCSGASPVLYDMIITDNTITGTSPRGAGISGISSSFRIEGCVVSRNTSVPSGADGGGISLYSCSNVVINLCEISYNSSGGHGAVYIAGSPSISTNTTISNCLIHGNIATTQECAGIYMSSANGVAITNCLITENLGLNDDSSAICIGGTPNVTISGCTICRNHTEQSGGGIWVNSSGAAPVISNCIIWGNTATGNGNQIYVNSTVSSVTLLNCCVPDNFDDVYDPGSCVTRSSCIDDKPHFRRGFYGRYYISASSPCANAGSSSVSNLAYLSTKALTTSNDNSRYIDSSDTADIGYHYPRFAANVYRVCGSTGDDNTGNGSPSAPFQTIQKGICASQTSDLVLVEPGIYIGGNNPNDSRNRDLDFAENFATGTRNITLLAESTSSPQDTIIDCQGSAAEPHRGFYFHSGETAEAVIDGFTIMNGYAPEETVSAGTFSTGGALCAIGSSPTIRNCCFLRNTANGANARGGAVSLIDNSDSSIISCTMKWNHAVGGGADGGALNVLSLQLSKYS